MVMLQDGRNIMGVLRSYDEFSNLVLEAAYERVIVNYLYSDIPLGLFIARGEFVVLVGLLDQKDQELPPFMTRLPEAEIRKAQKAEREMAILKGTMRQRMEFLDFD